MPSVDVTIEGTVYTGIFDGRTYSNDPDIHGLVDSGEAVVTFPREVLTEDPDEGDSATILGEDFIVSHVMGKGNVAVTVFFRFEDSDS